jgi:hypothetical protein
MTNSKHLASITPSEVLCAFLPHPFLQVDLCLWFDDLEMPFYANLDMSSAMRV